MGICWRYPLDDNCHREDTLAEIVSHAISRMELLEGNDRKCLIAEYKEWLDQEYDNDVLVLKELRKKLN